MTHHVERSRRRVLPIASAGLAIVALAAAACSSDSTGVARSGASQVAFMASSSASADVAAATAPITVNGHTLDLATVTLTITRIELKRAASDSCPGDDDGEDDHPSATPSTSACGELEIGPTTVTLPLSGGLVTLPANTLPAGSFSSIDIRVSSVELKGTFDTKSFDVTIPVHAKAEAHFATPLAVTTNAPTDVTVNVSVNNWLTNNDGSLIDPSTITSSPSLLERVKDRIAASLNAFEDRNHDGHDDHGDHGGN